MINFRCRGLLTLAVTVTITLNAFYALAANEGHPILTATDGVSYWDYKLHRDAGVITDWTYHGACITGAACLGEAGASGWGYMSSDVQVIFIAPAPWSSWPPFEIGTFRIYGNCGQGVGQWSCHDSSGYIDGSLAVTLSSFVATRKGVSVTLSWRTESETNNVGFHIYRSESKDGKFCKLAFVEGAGSTAMPTDYSFVDKTAKPGQTYFYYLEDIDVEGIRTKSQVVMSRKPINAATTWGKLKKS